MSGTVRGLRSLVLGVSTLVLLTGCSFDGAYDLPLPGSPVSDDDSFEVTAEFKDVLNVVPKSPVMVDDVVVGEVTDVQRVGWHARVTMRVKNDVVLPDNAIADIRQVSLLGEKYVALEDPVDAKPTGRLGEGDSIGLSETGRNPEVEEVLGALSFLLSGGGVAQLGTITKEANDAMSGRQDQLRSTLESLEGVVATIDDQKQDIIHAMESLNDLTGTLNNEKHVIGGALDAVGPAVDVLRSQHDELIAMLGSLDRLGQVGTRVIGAAKENTLKILDKLRPVLRGLYGAGNELGPGLNLLASFPFPKAAGDIIQGDYADTIARVQVDFSNLFKSIGIPDIQLPDPGETVHQVAACLQSGNLLGSACTRVLGNLTMLRDLQQQCKAPDMRTTPVCKAILLLPDLKSLGTNDGGIGGLDQFLGGLIDDPLAYPSSRQPQGADALIGGAV